MTTEIEKKEKKYQVKIFIHTAMFLGVLGLSVVMNETNDLSPLSTGFLAMTPVVPMIFMLRMIIQYYRTLDEYIQRVMGESLIWAVGVVGSAALAYGLLGEMVEVPTVSPAFMLPAIALIFGIAQFFILRGDDHEE